MICWKCQKDNASVASPERSDTCGRCGTSLRSCSNCEFYDEVAENKCRESRAPIVDNKIRSTHCQFFQVAITPHRLPPRAVTRDSLKKGWDSLFKD